MGQYHYLPKWIRRLCLSCQFYGHSTSWGRLQNPSYTWLQENEVIELKFCLRYLNQNIKSMIVLLRLLDIVHNFIWKAYTDFTQWKNVFIRKAWQAKLKQSTLRENYTLKEAVPCTFLCIEAWCWKFSGFIGWKLYG